MVETTVVGILVAHIGRCGHFFVGLQQAVISLSCCPCRPFRFGFRCFVVGILLQGTLYLND